MTLGNTNAVRNVLLEHIYPQNENNTKTPHEGSEISKAAGTLAKTLLNRSEIDFLNSVVAQTKQLENIIPDAHHYGVSLTKTLEQPVRDITQARTTEALNKSSNELAAGAFLMQNRFKT